MVRDVVAPGPQTAANLAAVCARRAPATTTPRWELMLSLISAGGLGLHLQVFVQIALPRTSIGILVGLIRYRGTSRIAALLVRAVRVARG